MKFPIVSFVRGTSQYRPQLRNQRLCSPAKRCLPVLCLLFLFLLLRLLSSYSLSTSKRHLLHPILFPPFSLLSSFSFYFSPFNNLLFISFSQALPLPHPPSLVLFFLPFLFFVIFLLPFPSLQFSQATQVKNQSVVKFSYSFAT